MIAIPTRKKCRGGIAATALVAAALFLFIPSCSSGDSRAAAGLRPAEQDHPGVDAASGVARGVVARVEDGDSITLTDGRRIRYAGIDTPEQGEPFSARARTENQRLVASKPIVWRQAGAETADRYGRLLALVEVEDQSSNLISVQGELLRAGLASIYLKDAHGIPASDLASLLEAQGAAIDGRRGIWDDRLQRATRLARPLVATRFRIHASQCEDLRARNLPAIQSIATELKLGKSLCRSCRPLTP